jgi:hypothetical protein
MRKEKSDKELTEQKIVECLLCWLIPGSGFLLKKAYVRGAVLFAIIMVTFAIGVALGGGVIWPVWIPGTEGFNIVNCLTFIVQLGGGVPALISLASDLDLGLAFLRGREWRGVFDLASFYLLISGAMNYFVVMNFYDRYYNKRHRKPMEKTP